MVSKYEFLFIVSGDESETRVKEIIGIVEQSFADMKATDIVSHILGKRKLSYALKGNVRYGTYVLTETIVDPHLVAQFHEKIRYVKGIVRSVLRVAGVAKLETFAATFNETERPVSRPALVEDVRVEISDVPNEISMHTASAPVEKVVIAAQPKLSQEELDRRIDALLEKEMDTDKL